MDLNACVDRICEIVDEIYVEWQETKGMLLTEADLQANIFHKLANDPLFSRRMPMADEGVFGKMLHSGVSWYGIDESEGKLCISPDITILEPEALSLLIDMSGGVKIPSKGFSFKGTAIIIEIKFQRYRKIQSKFLNGKSGLIKDAKNLNTLIEKFRNVNNANQIFGMQVVFDRFYSETHKNLIESIFENEEINPDRFRLIYK